MTLPISDIYESRVERETAIITRREAVVHRDENYAPPAALSDHDLDNYVRDGFLLVRNLFSIKEVATLRAEIDRMLRDPRLAGSKEFVAEPESMAIRSIFMVHRLSKQMRDLASDARLVRVAQQILGSDVYLHQSRVNMKPEFDGKEFYWHSDFETWHVEDGMPEMRAVSCSILLTENNAFNGPLLLIPGSHLYFISCIGHTPDEHYKQSLQRQQYGIPDQDSLRMLIASGGIQSMDGPAGSVVFFDCNAMHGSNGNISPYPRTNIFMVYNSVENMLREPRFGLHPRPEYIAARDHVASIKPGEFDFSQTSTENHGENTEPANRAPGSRHG